MPSAFGCWALYSQSGGDDSYRAGNLRGSWRTVANDIYLSFDAVMGSGGVVVASTRTTAGLFAHAATGAVSGLLFQLLTHGPANQSTNLLWRY